MSFTEALRGALEREDLKSLAYAAASECKLPKPEECDSLGVQYVIRAALVSAHARLSEAGRAYDKAKDEAEIWKRAFELASSRRNGAK